MLGKRDSRAGAEMNRVVGISLHDILIVRVRCDATPTGENERLEWAGVEDVEHEMAAVRKDDQIRLRAATGVGRNDEALDLELEMRDRRDAEPHAEGGPRLRRERERVAVGSPEAGVVGEDVDSGEDADFDGLMDRHVIGEGRRRQKQHRERKRTLGEAMVRAHGSTLSPSKLFRKNRLRGHSYLVSWSLFRREELVLRGFANGNHGGIFDLPFDRDRIKARAHALGASDATHAAKLRLDGARRGEETEPLSAKEV